MLFGLGKKTEIPSAEVALRGRAQPIPTAETHFVNGRPLKGPFPEGTEQVQVGMGCFWGVERMFWELPGVWMTAVGYAAGHTPNATYQEVCTGKTGHNEVVLITYDPEQMTFEGLLQVYWEGHDPTQGRRQGNDRGTQYRSGIYWTTDAQRAVAEATRTAFQARLATAGYGAITTEIEPASPFYYAEDYHQQYLAKNPGGYCGIGVTGVTCPIGTSA